MSVSLLKLGIWLTFFSHLTATVTVTIPPPTRRPRTHHRVNPYPVDRKQNETVAVTRKKCLWGNVPGPLRCRPTHAAAGLL